MKTPSKVSVQPTHDFHSLIGKKSAFVSILFTFLSDTVYEFLLISAIGYSEHYFFRQITGKNVVILLLNLLKSNINSSVLLSEYFFASAWTVLKKLMEA
jgi:hypothetical protein